MQFREVVLCVASKDAEIFKFLLKRIFPKLKKISTMRSTIFLMSRELCSIYAKLCMKEEKEMDNISLLQISGFVLDKISLHYPTI